MINSRLLQFLNFKNVNASSAINWLLVGYAFSLPLSKAGTVLFEILTILIFFTQFVWIKKIKTILKVNFFSIVILFLTYSLINALTLSPDLEFALNYIKKYWHLLMIPIIFLTLKEEYFYTIIIAFLIGMTISSCVSIGIFMEWITYKNILPSDPSPFMDHTNFSMYLALAITILTLFLIEKKYLMNKSILLAMLFIMTIVLFINAGRTGQVAVIIGVIFIILSSSKHKFFSISLGFFLIISITSIAYLVSPVFKERANTTFIDIQTMSASDDYSGGVSKRISLWILGIHTFIDHPLVGTGIGNEIKEVKKYSIEYHFVDYIDSPSTGYIDFHNAFLQYGVQLGILGLILFLLIFIELFKLRFDNSLYSKINMSFILMMLTISFVGLSLHIMSSMVLFALFSGILLAVSKNRTQTSESSIPHHKKTLV